MFWITFLNQINFLSMLLPARKMPGPVQLQPSMLGYYSDIMYKEIMPYK